MQNHLGPAYKPVGCQLRICAWYKLIILYAYISLGISPKFCFVLGVIYTAYLIIMYQRNYDINS